MDNNKEISHAMATGPQRQWGLVQNAVVTMASARLGSLWQGGRERKCQMSSKKALDEKINNMHGSYL